MSAREEPLQAHSTHKCQFTMSRVPAGRWNLPEAHAQLLCWGPALLPSGLLQVSSHSCQSVQLQKHGVKNSSLDSATNQLAV